MAAVAFLDAQIAARPDLAPWFTEMSDLYQKKLWHQLTLKLEQFLALAVMQVRNELPPCMDRVGGIGLCSRVALSLPCL